MHAANRLRIAIVTETYLPEVNGVTRSLDRMVTGIRQKGHDVSVFRPVQESDGANAVTVAVDSLSGLGYDTWELKRGLRWIGQKLKNLGRRVRKQQPAQEGGQLTHHLSAGLRMPFYREVQVGLASPHFFRARFKKERPDLVHIVTEGPLGFNALLAARSCGIPVISDYRTHFDQYFHYYGMATLGKWVSWYLRTFHNLTRQTLVPTQSMKQELTEKGFKRVSVISRGVDTDMYSPAHRCGELRNRYGIGDDDLVVLYAGRLAPEKNIDLAIKSFREMKRVREDARMILVGDGPERARLEREHPDLIFTGFLSGDNLSAHYASSDVFLFPSLTDTFGNVVTEAAASGLAVVSYDRGAARELLEHGYNAWIAREESDGSFLEASRDLAELSRKSPQALINLRRNARELATSVSWDSVVSRLEGMYYESLIKKIRFRKLVQWRMRRSRMT